MLAKLGARQSLNGLDVFDMSFVQRIITLSELFVCLHPPCILTTLCACSSMLFYTECSSSPVPFQMQQQPEEIRDMGSQIRVQLVDEQILSVIKAAAVAPEREGLGMLAQLHHLMEIWEQRARGQQPEGEVEQQLLEADVSSSRGSGRDHGLRRRCRLVGQSLY